MKTRLPFAMNALRLIEQHPAPRLSIPVRVMIVQHGWATYDGTRYALTEAGRAVLADNPPKPRPVKPPRPPKPPVITPHERRLMALDAGSPELCQTCKERPAWVCSNRKRSSPVCNRCARMSAMMTRMRKKHGL